jgi:hypothetical protein
VLRELRDKGIDNSRVVVLSGFRAPYYNDLRIDGRGAASRHQFGDAADIIIDADGNGQMDDLNGDRRSDLRDLSRIGAAVASVERRYPELIGGLGRTLPWVRADRSLISMSAAPALDGSVRKTRRGTAMARRGAKAASGEIRVGVATADHRDHVFARLS